MKRRSMTQPWSCVHGGTSATLVALVEGRTLYTANVGDSSALLAMQGRRVEVGVGFGCARVGVMQRTLKTSWCLAWYGVVQRPLLLLEVVVACWVSREARVRVYGCALDFAVLGSRGMENCSAPAEVCLPCATELPKSSIAHAEDVRWSCT